MRWRNAIPCRAQLAPEFRYFVPLAEHSRQTGENSQRGPEDQENEQRQDHRRLPGFPQEKAQGHRIRVHECEKEYRQEQKPPQQPRQMSDEFHT